MWKWLKSTIAVFDSLFSWLSTSLKQTTASYCDIQTADSATTLVANDGSLVSVIRIDGVRLLIGRDEFEQIQTGLQHTFQTTMSQNGHTIQVYFGYNKDEVKGEISSILQPAHDTAQRLGLSLEDLFSERENHLSGFCAH